MEAPPALDASATLVIPLQRVLPVSARTHRVGKLFTKRLEIERMTTRNVVRTLTRIVIEVPGPDHAEPFVQGLQIVEQRHPPRAMSEFVGVEKMPPDVLVRLGLRHFG